MLLIKWNLTGVCPVFLFTLHRSIRRIRDGYIIRGLKHIGIDEIYYCKGHKHATVGYDLGRVCVVWVGKGKDRHTIDQFSNEALGDYRKRQIK